MKSFNKLTNEEILALTSDELLEATQIQALEGKIRIPITYKQKIERGILATYFTPKSATTVYELWTQYSGTGICFMSEGAATNALQGAFYLSDSSYPKEMKLCSGDIFSVKVRKLIESGEKIAEAIVDREAEEDYKDFYHLLNDNTKLLEQLKQEAVDQTRRADRRKKYLELAFGNEEIAKSFWVNTENCNWPKVDGSYN